jgi:hypothetical protein
MGQREPSEVVAEYFSRMRARDIGVVDLFHEDACLVGLGSVKSGRPSVRAFYSDVIERAGPVPRAAGPLLTGGDRVAAEVYIDLPGGAMVHAVDVFEVREGRIRSLTYFLANHPAEADGGTGQ